MMAGELDATMAYMSGKLKVEGDMAVAMKLSSVI
jgi:putative sterol carrier protein